MSITSSPVVIWAKKHKKGCALFLVLFVILCFITDLAGLGGNIRFYAKWLDCGKKPVVSAYVFKQTPHYIEDPPVHPTIRLLPDQFCSPKEAELAGYSSTENGYHFQYLNAEEKEEVYYKYLSPNRGNSR